MGLDTSHDCWHGAYSSFHRFRKKICEVAGYGDLDKFDGFSDTDPGIPWPTDDPLVKLLNHSDCDGEIAATDCGPVADSLEELLPALERAGDCAGHIGSYVDAARKFIAGLRDAAAKNEAVGFY